MTEEYLFHEFAHSYVNPVVHEHVARFAGDSPALDAAASVMAQQGYATREIVVQESIIRALTVLYLYDTVGLDAANASLQTQLDLGFAWTLELVQALDTTDIDTAGADR